MLLTAAPYFKGFEFQSMIVFSLIMGLFDGCFITMLGPIAYDICGPAGASQAIGFLLGLCSIPLTLGPPIAGEGLYRIFCLLAFKRTKFCKLILCKMHTVSVKFFHALEIFILAVCSTYVLCYLLSY